MKTLMFTPANNRHLIDKALQLENLDCIVLDIEDSIRSEEQKQIGRRNIREYAQDGKFQDKKVYIRINEITDIPMVCIPGVTGIMVPKIREGSEMIEVFWRLRDTGGDYKVILLVETSSAVLNLKELIQKANNRIIGLAFGSEDFRADVGDFFEIAQDLIVMNAKAHGLQAWDMIYQREMDPEGLRMDSRKSRNRGFDGRLIAHPLEIKPVQEGYSIDYIEYLDAKEILKQYYQSEKGVLYIDGKVIGPPHVKRYERIIEKYETQK